MEEKVARKKAGEQFQPLLILSDWVEPGTTTKRLTVAVLLPSGVTSGMFSVRIADDGNSSEITVTWPDSLVDLKFCS